MAGPTRTLLMLFLLTMPSWAFAEEAGDAERPSLKSLTRRQLTDEYTHELQRRPGYGGPLGFIFGGAGAGALGVLGVSIFAGDRNPHPDVGFAALMVTLVAAGVASIAGGVVWAVQRREARAEADARMAELTAELDRRGLELLIADDPQPAIPEPEEKRPSPRRSEESGAARVAGELLGYALAPFLVIGFLTALAALGGH